MRFDTWLAKEKELKPITQIMAPAIAKTGSKFVQERFLALAQAIEGYCRLRCNGTYFCREKYKLAKQGIEECIRDNLANLIDGLDGSALSDFNNKVRGSVGCLNSLSFKSRLRNLFAANEWLRPIVTSEFESDASAVEQFLTDVVRSRNDLTHLERNRQPTLDTLHNSERKLLIALGLLLLSESCLPVSELDPRALYWKDCVWWR